MKFARAMLVFLCLSSAMLIFAQKAEVSSTSDKSSKSETLRVDVDLVLVNAVVTDSDNRFVTGLKPENFEIWEDKVPQEIQYFSNEDVPLSAGIIFDVSGSMQATLPVARSAAVTFLRMGNPEDEYFLVEFSDSAQLAQDFTADITKLQQRIAFNNARGRTALYDALYLGLDTVSHGSNSRKALVLITDGQDNHSRYSFANVREFAKERDVQVYAIGLTDPSQVGMQPIPMFSATAPLNDLANVTGGRAFFPTSVYQLEDICTKIGLDLRNQYVLGYKSTNTAKDGKWRKLKVKVNRPQGMPRMGVRAKSGYYASALERVSK
jgi:Ca-activated chloride channel family protein